MFRTLLSVALCFVACDQNVSPPKTEPIATVTVAIGPDVYSQRIDRFVCEPEGAVVRLEALADPTGKSDTPFRSAIARFRDDHLIEAYVFVANQNVAGEDYTVIVLSAEPEKNDTAECRIEAETIVCNNVKRTPWRDPLPRTAAFKIPLGCRD